MIRSILLSALLLWGCIAATTKQPGDRIIPYPFAKDSFLVRINNLAAGAGPSDTVHVVYYADESLKSGKQMGKLIDEYRDQLTKKNYVFVGIAHFGQYRVKRRRDFIAPSVKTDHGYKGVSDSYGQADSFYFFLKHTVMPAVEKDFEGRIIRRSFIGHSLGGLFATYLLVKDDSLFSNLYALSPSLWIDDYHILEYESLHQAKLRERKKQFWISCGSREDLNRIESGVKRMADTLQKRAYPGMLSHVKIYEGETHNSSVEPALREIVSGFIKE